MSSFFAFSPEHLLKLEQLLASGNEIRSVSNREQYIDLLIDTPGIDPVRVAIKDTEAAIPQSGFLVRSMIAPNYCGTFLIEKYFENSLNLVSVRDNRSVHNEATANFVLKNYVSHSVSYSNPLQKRDANGMPDPAILPVPWLTYGYGGYDETILNSGGILKEQTTPALIANSSLHFGLKLDTKQRNINSIGPARVEVNRVTSSEEELGGIILQLAFGMGLDKIDARTLLENTGRKLAGIAAIDPQ